MPQPGHSRPGEPLSPTIYYPLSSESDLIVARTRNDAKGPGCVKSRTDAMILRVNRRSGALDVRLRGGD
jgi:hypothetical protein